MSTRHHIFVLALGISLLAPAASALAVPLPRQSQPGFGISPARQEVIGTPPLQLTPTTVLNGTSRTVRVTVFPVILTQDLTGAFGFSPAPRNLNDAKLVLTVGPTGVTLAPGQSQQVALRWNLLPVHQPWVAAGVIYQGVPEQQTGPLHVISRLLGISFLRLPGNYRIAGHFTGLFPEQTTPRVLRFVARVKNTGQMFAAPSAGKLMVRDSGGKTVLSEPWSGSVILPGASVDFPILTNQVLPAGHYTAAVTMSFGGPRSLTVPFTLVGPNQFPTPAIAIRAFNAAGQVGSPAKVTARIVSDGTAPAGVTLHLFLGRTSDVGTNAPALATGQVSERNLAPGLTVTLSRPLGRDLRKGSYTVIGTWTDPTGAPHTVETEFVTTPAASWFAPIWAVLEPILIGLLALGLLLLVASLVRRMVDRQRQTEAELAAARERLQAAGLDATLAPDKPPGPAPGRIGGTRATRPKRSPASNGSAAKRGPRTKTSGAAQKPASARSTRAKPKANGEGNQSKRAPGVAPRASAPSASATKSPRAPARSRPLANGARATGAKPTTARTAAPKDDPPKRAARPPGSNETDAKPTQSRTNRAKTSAATSTAPKTSAANTARAGAAKARGTKAGGAKATSTRASAAKSPSQKRTRSKPAAAKPTASQSTQSPITVKPAPSEDGGSAGVPSTAAKPDRAAELLSLASRSHTRRPKPIDRGDG